MILQFLSLNLIFIILHCLVTTITNLKPLVKQVQVKNNLSTNSVYFEGGALVEVTIENLEVKTKDLNKFF